MPPSQGSAGDAGHSRCGVKSLTLLQADGAKWRKCALVGIRRAHRKVVSITVQPSNASSTPVPRGSS